MNTAEFVKRAQAEGLIEVEQKHIRIVNVDGLEALLRTGN